MTEAYLKAVKELVSEIDQKLSNGRHDTLDDWLQISAYLQRAQKIAEMEVKVLKSRTIRG